MFFRDFPRGGVRRAFIQEARHRPLQKIQEGSCKLGKKTKTFVGFEGEPWSLLFEMGRCRIRVWSVN